jgi:putative DNA primase/helicase
MTNAAEIAEARGGGPSGDWWRCACPVHGGNALALRDGQFGLVVHCHAGCPPAEVLAALGVEDYVPGPVVEPDPQRRIEFARAIWREAIPDTGLVAEYLRGRGIHSVSRALRLMPTYRRYGRHPCGFKRPQMVAPIQRVTGEVVGVHRTFLAVDGKRKATVEPAKMMHGVAKGCAVHLAPLGPMLLIAEGIETALSGMQATGLPAWAALSAGGLESVLVPETVRELGILADHDKVGLGAAERAAGDLHMKAAWPASRYPQNPAPTSTIY